MKEVILITGANGLVGTAITQALPNSLCIVGMNRKCEEEANCVPIDLGSEHSIRESLHQIRERYGNRIASVIHLAAYFDFTGEPDPKYEQVNVRGTSHLLRELQSFQVEQFIYASTMLVHAPTQPGKPINENFPLQPKWAYPQSKFQAEKIALSERGKIPLVVLRIAGVYTDWCQSPTLAHQIKRIYERQLQSYFLPADPAVGQSAVHLDDLAAVFPLLIQKRSMLPNEAIFLIGEPEAMGYDDIQDEVGRLMHGKEDWQTLQIPKPIAKAGAWLQDKVEDVVPDIIDKGKEPFIKPFMIDLAEDHFELDISRARETLGWHPKNALREALPKMVTALKTDPLTWYRKNGLHPPAWLEDTTDHPQESGRIVQSHRQWVDEQHEQTLWAHFANMLLACWLITSPVSLGYSEEIWLTWSDIASGVLVLLFSVLSLSQRLQWARWATTLVGLWLLFAPLVFWTESPAAYASDTLIGMLVITFALIIPPEPGVSILARSTGPDIPPGWDYCPSTWIQRIPIILLALVGFLFSRYLTAYQLGHIDNVWDPFFGDGTETIITSEVSEAWPIPDAGLGAITYVLEILSGVIGSKQRWRTMPWIVILFGILIVPLGVVSIFFIIIQPIVIGTWCTLCLIGALAMLIQIPYSLDEILATGQFLLQRRRAGKPFWRTFFRGDTVEGGSKDNTPLVDFSPNTIRQEFFSASVNMPWTLLLSGVIGGLLMSTRLLFDTEGSMVNSDHIVGSLVIAVSIIAWAEIARPIRLINVLFGAWLVIAPWVLSGESTVAAWASMGLGLGLIALSLPRGKVEKRYNAWNRFII